MKISFKSIFFFFYSFLCLIVIVYTLRIYDHSNSELQNKSNIEHFRSLNEYFTTDLARSTLAGIYTKVFKNAKR